jgi:hypothetical protein
MARQVDGMQAKGQPAAIALTHGQAVGKAVAVDGRQNQLAHAAGLRRGHQLIAPAGKFRGVQMAVRVNQAGAGAGAKCLVISPV